MTVLWIRLSPLFSHLCDHCSAPRFPTSVRHFTSYECISAKTFVFWFINFHTFCKDYKSQNMFINRNIHTLKSGGFVGWVPALWVLMKIASGNGLVPGSWANVRSFTIETTFSEIWINMIWFRKISFENVIYKNAAFRFYLHMLTSQHLCDWNFYLERNRIQRYSAKSHWLHMSVMVLKTPATRRLSQSKIITHQTSGFISVCQGNNQSTLVSFHKGSVMERVSCRPPLTAQWPTRMQQIIYLHSDLTPYLVQDYKQYVLYDNMWSAAMIVLECQGYGICQTITMPFDVKILYIYTKVWKHISSHYTLLTRILRKDTLFHTNIIMIVSIMIWVSNNSWTMLRLTYLLH